MNRSFKKKVAPVLITVGVTSMLWGSAFLSVSKQANDRDKEISTLKESITLVADKDTIKIAKEIKGTGYNVKEYLSGYEDQCYEYEADLDERDAEIRKLKKQVSSIKKSYSKKLENSELTMYHLKSSVLSDTQLAKADEIAYIVAGNYETYGVLPSVAVGQAMQETQIGSANTSASSSYGYWGVISTTGYASYSSLYEGVISYLKCLNNGRYDGALFEKNYLVALNSIQNGGYCQPSDGYASSVSNCIANYNFKEYDNYYLGE